MLADLISPYCRDPPNIKIIFPGYRNSHNKDMPWDCVILNTFRPRQMATIFQTTFSNAFSWMKMYEFWLKFHWSLFPRVRLSIFQHWVQIMAWRRPGDKPLSEPMMVRLLTHICITRPQWVKTRILILVKHLYIEMAPCLQYFLQVGQKWITQEDKNLHILLRRISNKLGGQRSSLLGALPVSWGMLINNWNSHGTALIMSHPLIKGSQGQLANVSAFSGTSFSNSLWKTRGKIRQVCPHCAHSPVHNSPWIFKLDIPNSKHSFGEK